MTAAGHQDVVASVFISCAVASNLNGVRQALSRQGPGSDALRLGDNFEDVAVAVAELDAPASVVPVDFAIVWQTISLMGLRYSPEYGYERVPCKDSPGVAKESLGLVGKLLHFYATKK
jgi:hypothetical protein